MSPIKYKLLTQTLEGKKKLTVKKLSQKFGGADLARARKVLEMCRKVRKCRGAGRGICLENGRRWVWALAEVC